MIVSASVVVATALLACYFSAVHAVLKTFSRKRLGDLLTERGREDELPRVTNHLPGLVLMTGVVRSALNVLGVLAVLWMAVKWSGRSGALAGDWRLWAVTFAVALTLQGVFSVAIAVSWARYQGERLLLWSGPLLHAMRIVFWPVTQPLHVLDPLIRRLSGVDLRDDEEDLSDQIIAAVEDHDAGGEVADDQKQMIEAVFDLRETDAAAVMTPRTDVQGIEVTASLTQVKALLLEEGHSRVPVYRENLDDIAGILYAKDLLPLLDSGNLDSGNDVDHAQTFDLAGRLREPMLIPESKNVLELLREFRSTQVHLAIVVDEYGGTAGLVTIEDILEEIVGEIHDEYEEDAEAPGVESLDADRFRVDARLPINDLNDRLDLNIPEDEEYDTVGGFVLEALGHIPDANETFEIHQVKVTVEKAEKTHVVAVVMEKINVEAAG
ncbi:MAG: hemolysin family protein [Algisphaera sp.]